MSNDPEHSEHEQSHVTESDIEDAIHDGAGCDYGIEPRHLDKIEGTEVTPEGVRFTIERHPHLLGRPSKGRASSIFTTITTTYLLHNDRTISLAREEVGQVEYDIDALVEEEITATEEGGMISRLAKAGDEEIRAEVGCTCDNLIDEITTYIGDESGKEIALKIAAEFRPYYEEALLKAIAKQREWDSDD